MALKKCKVCGKEYTLCPARRNFYGDNICSPECFVEYTEAVIKSREKNTDAKKTKKSKKKYPVIEDTNLNTIVDGNLYNIDENDKRDEKV